MGCPGSSVEQEELEKVESIAAMDRELQQYVHATFNLRRSKSTSSKGMIIYGSREHDLAGAAAKIAQYMDSSAFTVLDAAHNQDMEQLLSTLGSSAIDETGSLLHVVIIENIEHAMSSDNKTAFLSRVDLLDPYGNVFILGLTYNTFNTLDSELQVSGRLESQIEWPFRKAKPSIFIRKANVDDLPTIHDLIRQSFEAMIPHSWLWPSFWRNAASGLIDSELSAKAFAEVYLSGDNYFWVAELIEDGAKKVVGCVGIKSKSDSSDVELVRMAVDAKIRGSGIGKLLIDSLIEHCKETKKFTKILLYTGNPDAIKFYEKCGFIAIPHFLFWSAEYNLR